MIFLALALTLAPLDWYALRKGNTRLGYFTKPGVILALLAWLLVYAQPFSSVPGPGWIHIQWFVWALLFSLVGDVLLMLPREQFMGALAAFSIAHIALIQGFAQPVFPERYALPGVIISLMVIAVSLRVYLPIARAIRAAGKNEMKIPAAVYALLITAMLIAAVSTLVKGWGFASSYLAVGGGLLFYISDIFLAWDRFVAPLPNADLKVRVLYHLAQICIVTGAALHHLGIA
jgi:uncharacterized membrane protein YhhN